MLQKTYSETICLEEGGPDVTSKVKSTCQLNSERSYCTSIYFVPKLIAKRSYLTVDGEPENIEAIAKKAFATYNRSCSFSNGSVKSYESAVSIDQENSFSKQVGGLDVLDGLKCSQNIELVPGLVMKDFSESVYIFPKTKTNSFRSNTTRDDLYLKKTYIVGLEVHKFREVSIVTEESTSFTSSMHIATNKSQDSVINGELDDCL